LKQEYQAALSTLRRGKCLVINDGQRPETFHPLSGDSWEKLQPSSNKVSCSFMQFMVKNSQPSSSKVVAQFHAFTIPLRSISVAITPDSAFGGHG